MLGVCYYPEHWPEDLWAEDAARMARIGLTYVRVGEFAWSAIEPDPGRYDWGWLDRAVGDAGGRRPEDRHGHADRDPAEMAGRRPSRHPGP